jgi:hypothetical protein
MSTASKAHLGDIVAAEFLAQKRAEHAPGLDKGGRLRRLTPAERRERSEAIRRSLAAIEAIGDDSDDIDWDEAERDFDSFRPHRPLLTQPGSSPPEPGDAERR